MTPSSHGKGKKADKALVEEDIAALRALNKDSAFFQAKYEELLRQHPEQWVCIFNQEVAGVSAVMDELLHELEKKGVPLDQALFEYLTDEEPHPVVH